MRKTRFGSQGVILRWLLNKKLKKKNLFGTRDPPSFNGKSHEKLPLFFGTLPLNTEGPFLDVNFLDVKTFRRD